MSDMIENYARRLGIHDSETLEKANELWRLIKLKHITINDAAKVVLCIDCAALCCATALDRKDAILLSGLKQKEYIRHKELFDIWLNLTKKLTLDEICAQLDVSDVLKNDAAQLLSEYKKRHPHINDADNAHCLTMAIYQSFKLKNIKGSSMKTKLIQLSKLKGNTWKNFEDEWDKWIREYQPLADQENRNEIEAIQNKKNVDAVAELQTNLNQNEHEDLSYEEWRESILKKSEAILK